MKKIFLRINVMCYLIIVCFLALSVVTSMSSGYPWAITCYNCSLCRQACPLGIDVQGIVTAAISNDPHLSITANRIRLRLGEAMQIDPEMMLQSGRSAVRAGRLLADGTPPETEFTVSMMKAKDAAGFCPLCGNCEKPCPISLPVMKIIEDLRKDGRFKR